MKQKDSDDFVSESNDEKSINNIYKKNKNGIEIEVRDPIYDVMSENEIDEANLRISKLLE